MAPHLNINGKVIEEPSSEEIAQSFDELSKMKSFALGPRTAIAILARDEAHRIMAAGTRAAGFVLSYREGDADSEYVIEPGRDVEFAEVIRIFQAYARGEDWGKETFNWERKEVAANKSRLIRALLVAIILGSFALVIARKFLAK